MKLFFCYIFLIFIYMKKEIKFVYYTDEWNEEKITRSDTNVSRVDTSSEGTDSSSEQEEV